MKAGITRRVAVVYGVALVLVLAFGYLCFELGRYEAGYSVLDQRRAGAAYRQQLSDERAAAEELRRQLAILETSREIDRETYAQVEADLGELQARIQAQEEELVFYRGIVSPQDGVAGLRIQSLEAVPSDAQRHYLLRLVLVQAIVHSRRVAGVVKLRVVGHRDGQATAFDLEDLAPAEGSAGGSDSLAYGFRYFQGLESELVLPVGFEPETVEVEIQPTEPRGERLTQSFAWSAIA
jgi:hypothetical protein